ncbi:MAG: radical SAM protein, partial [Desulfobacterales bacterium]|nr:radical SAM protein [Desulfobacterales bacterium]
NNIKKRFIVQSRIEIAKNPRLLEKAEKAGFKLFLIGIESPHDRILKQLHKGFTQKQVREAFKVLNRYNFYIHAYFIYGNIGETEEEMLYIPEFAKELKVDSITFQKLRIERYSPLKELVDKTPGYYYGRIGGSVYSDRFDRKALKEISTKIKFNFYTASRIKAAVKKAYKIELLTRPNLILLFMIPPFLLLRVLKREIWEKRSFAKTLGHILVRG